MPVFVSPWYRRKRKGPLLDQVHRPRNTNVRCPLWPPTPLFLFSPRHQIDSQPSPTRCTAQPNVRVVRCPFLLTVLSVEDETLLCAFYESKLQDICRQDFPGRLTERVLAAASVFFKRFYLCEPMSSEEPKGLMLAAIYLAAKVEEERVTVEELVPRYAKLKPEELLALEMRLLQALSFQVVTRSPFRCLSGLMHELHADLADGGVNKTLSGAAAKTKDASHDASLESVHRAAISHVCRMLRTDVPLLFSPQLIALAALDAAAREQPAEAAVDVRGWTERRFRPGAGDIKGGSSGGDGVASLGGSTVAELQEQLRLLEEAASASAVDLNAEGAMERLKQADKQLKELSKAVRLASRAREDRRSD